MLQRMQVEPSHDAEGEMRHEHSKGYRIFMGESDSEDESSDPEGRGGQQPGGGKKRFVAL